jgi:hypothetical protein
MLKRIISQELPRRDPLPLVSTQREQPDRQTDPDAEPECGERNGDVGEHCGGSEVLRAHRQSAILSARHQSPRDRIAVRRETENGRINLSAKVPPNSNAEVHMPGLDVSQITKSGKPILDLIGVGFLRQEGKTVVLETGSGDYHFTAAVVR